MYRNCFLLSLFILFFSVSHAQYFKLSGKVTTNKLEPLALASVEIQGMKMGAVTKEDGTWELRLEPGDYTLVITMMGYKPQVIRIVLTKDYVQNIILEPDEARNLSEVVVKGKVKDRSEEIIRNVIRHKEEILAAAGPYSCQVYIKATQEDSLPPKIKSKKPVVDSLQRNKDLQGMAMAEISLRYDHEADNKVKEERNGVVKRGDPEALFYLSLTEGDFNLYNNLIKARVLSQVPFLSPVSYGGLAAYKYKLVSTRQSGARKIYTISIRPKELSNVTVQGQLEIMDSAWVILSAKFILPEYHIPEYDLFEVNQQYTYVDNKAWMITRQQFRYYSKHGKGKLSGETTAIYSGFELNKEFPKKYFGPEVSATAQEAYERDSSFWEKTRVEPLTEKEVRFIRYKDSIYRVMHSKAYLDSIDRKTNKITLMKALVFGQVFYNREKQRTWNLPPITSVYELFEFGGARLSLSGSYFKTYKSRKNIAMYAESSYGFRNHDVNWNINFNRMYNPFNRGYYALRWERDFEYIYTGDAWINMINRSNFYLNHTFGVGHGLELANGLFLTGDVDIAFRRSLANYKTNRHVDSLLGGILDNNHAIAFDPYNAAYGKIRLQFTPRQRYIREPKEKIILGSKWPTFYAQWRKGVPGPFKSKVNFDYLEFGIEQELKLGTLGVSKYTIKSGSFLNKKDLRLVDYQFQRRGDPVLFMNPQEAFQSLDSTFPVYKRFYQAHYLHEFNGALLNKIPFLKKLQLREIAGGGFLIAPERNLRYGEFFTGIERVFKWPFNPLFKFKMGVYVVASAANQFKNPVQFKIGFTSWDRKRNKWL